MNPRDAQSNTPLIASTSRGERIAFVEQRRGAWALVTSKQRDNPIFSAWQWAWLGSKDTIGVVFAFPVAALDHNGNTVLLHSMMDSWRLPRKSAPAASISAVLSEPLAKAWMWDGAGEQPVICTTYVKAPATPNTAGPMEALDIWRTRVVPESARIIRSLYCPDGRLENLTAARLPNAYYDVRWAGAAAREARVWLSFYKREGCHPIDRRHWANVYHLRQIVALALLGRACKPNRLTWSDMWADDLSAAVDDWVKVCADESLGWFFDPQWWLDAEPAPLFNGLVERQRRREYEINRVTEALRRTLAANSAAGSRSLQDDLCRKLEMLALTWYLPHYDIGAARQIEQVVSLARGTPMRPWPGMLTGMGRMYGGVGVGLLAAGLQSDTWKLLVGLISDRPLIAVLVTIGMMAGTLSYLAVGIRRRIQLPAFDRALAVWLRGQAAALAGSGLLAFLVTPRLVEEQLLQEMPPLAWLGLPIMLAQLALFIGIFTQLLFDEKPTTAPLNVP